MFSVATVNVAINDVINEEAAEYQPQGQGKGHAMPYPTFEGLLSPSLEISSMYLQGYKKRKDVRGCEAGRSSTHGRLTVLF